MVQSPSIEEMNNVQATVDWSVRFSDLARRTSPPEISWLMAQALEVPGMISLAAGFVDQATLPNRDVLEAIAVINEQSNDVRNPLQYGTTHGNMDLRQQLIAKLQGESVFHSDAEIDERHIMLGSGSQQVLYLACEVLLNPGDIVLLEAPTYFVVLGAIGSRGAETVGIDTDEMGLIPESLETCLAELERDGRIAKVKMLYLMTYSTNPCGVTLAEERRERILDILRTYRDKGYPILLLEDAAYRRLVFDQPAPSPIKRYDECNDLVLYTESFSKSLSPGLRMGFGIGPKVLIDKMVDIKGNHDFGSSNLSQQILGVLLQNGMFDRHVEALRERYRQKAELVTSILREQFSTGIEWIEPSGGFYTWMELPESVDTGTDGAMFQAALEEKVLYVPGALCYSSDREESKRSSSLRLSFGMIDEARLREGCVRLARAIRNVI